MWKNKLFKVLAKPYSAIIILAIASLLSLSDRNFGYFFGLGIVLFMAWRSKWDWSLFGFGKKIKAKTVWQSFWLVIPLFLGLSIIEPFLQQYFGAFNLSSLDHIRGDLGNYIMIMIIMWVFAAFGEELLFRGYYMQWFAKFAGNTNAAWLFSALFISIYFGISHAYQGTAGIIAVTIGSLYFSMVYYKNKENLALAALVHGFYDTIGLTLIYFNKDDVISDWVLHVMGAGNL